MKKLGIILWFTICVCISTGIGYLLSDKYNPESTYQIRREPPIMLNRWQVMQADSVCYTGSIADCQAWIDTEEYRKN